MDASQDLWRSSGSMPDTNNLLRSSEQALGVIQTTFDSMDW